MNYIRFTFLLISFLILQGSFASTTDTIQIPVLKWGNGGCTTWCKTGWYSSPAVTDIDNDGTAEVIAGTYELFVLNGEDGSVQWSDPGTGGRIWPGVVVADIDNNTDLEIVIARSGGWVTAYNHNNTVLWSVQLDTSEFRGLSAADLDNNNHIEIIATLASGSNTNTWILNSNGAIASGWPQVNGGIGSAWGTYNDTAAIGDIDNDGVNEIIVPSDVNTIQAYEGNGSEIDASASVFGGGKVWGNIPAYENPATEIRGWGICSDPDRNESYRANFAYGPAVIADINNDGSNEIIVMGNMQSCATSPYSSKYITPFILNKDRTRYSTGENDWSTPPLDTGTPLSEDSTVIETAMSNPAVADLDGDGAREIVFASYDGRVHALWLDKTEHGNWPYSVYNSGEGFIRFASEPVIVDLDNDGFSEVIFASWTENSSGQNGKLHITDHLGNLLREVELPPRLSGTGWNGVLAAPTLANIDDDADLEIVLNSAYSGVLAYDLPGSDKARILWGTGRGNYLRNAAIPAADTDHDGVIDTLDNCTLEANGPLIPDAGGHVQRDTDGDGLGNSCDADLDNDCSINFIDLGLMKSVFFGSDADADLDGDGAVNFVDLGIMKASFFGPPGPSAVPNACE